MIILKEQLTDQTFRFIPRELKADTLVFTNESTNEEVSYVCDFYKDSYYLSVTDTFTLKEGTFYSLKVLNNNDIVYRDRVFCTNQNLDTFSINNGQYTDHQTTNEWIIID